jgi:exosortase
MSMDAMRAGPGRGQTYVFAVLTVSILLFWPGAVSLATLWTDARAETYTSGFLIAAISAWLLWRKRRELVPAPIEQTLPAPWNLLALLVLAGGGLAWLFALRAGIQIVYLTTLPVLWWLCLLLACGWRAARVALFPLGFLVFAMPVWDHAIPLLQWLTVHVVRVALRLTGVPSYFFGEMVQIPAGVFEIQGGCSGLHYFIVGLAVTVLLGELRQDPWRTRLRWVLVGGALAVASNWLRVYTIILAGHLTHMQSYLVRVSHYSYGWFVFMAGLLAFVLYVRYNAPPSRAHTPTGGLNESGAVPAPRWLALVALVASIPAALHGVIAARLPADAGSLIGSLPATPPHDWRVSVVESSEWQPVQAGADTVRRWRFTRGEEVIEMYAAGYVEQRQRKKLGGRANVPAGLEASVLDESRASAGGRGFVAQEVEQQGARFALWRGYQVGDRWFAGATRAQFWYAARTLMTLQSPPSRVWMLRTRCALDCNAAGQRLGRFVEENGEWIWPESP